LGVTWTLGGLDFHSGGLYGINGEGASLYSINTSTGAATLIGPTGVLAALESFEIIDGVGYSQDTLENTLYSISLGTGSATAIGGYDDDFGRVTGLAEWNGVLYGIRFFHGDLVILDPTTGGISSVVGVHGLSNATSLALADGRFWTKPAFDPYLYSLDPSTGAPLTWGGVGFEHITGLAGPEPLEAPVPEPSTAALLCVGLGTLAARRRRRR
jgi:hypothetical protein